MELYSCRSWNWSACQWHPSGVTLTCIPRMQEGELVHQITYLPGTTTRVVHKNVVHSNVQKHSNPAILYPGSSWNKWIPIVILQCLYDMVQARKEESTPVWSWLRTAGKLCLKLHPSNLWHLIRAWELSWHPSPASHCSNRSSPPGPLGRLPPERSLPQHSVQLHFGADV